MLAALKEKVREEKPARGAIFSDSPPLCSSLTAVAATESSFSVLRVVATECAPEGEPGLALLAGGEGGL